MAAPVDSARVATNISTAGTSHAISIGSPVAGTLVIVYLRCGGAPGSTTMPAGWTNFINTIADASDDYTGAWYRWATGSEGATVTFQTGNSVKVAAIAWEITGAANPTDSVPSASSEATGTTAANSANPNAAAPDNPPQDTLYLAVMGGDAASGGVTGAPASYSNLIAANTGTGGTTTTNARIGGASRQILASSTDNPGAFTHGALLTAWSSHTIAINPPPSVAHTFDGVDSVGLADSYSDSVGVDLQATDTLDLSVDLLDISMGWDLTADDTVALADSLVLDLVLIADLADSLTFSDLFDSQLDQNLEPIDTVALVDLFNGILDIVTDLTDSLPLDDLFDSVVGSALDLADTVGLIDSFSSVVGANEIAFTDVVTLADDVTWTAAFTSTFTDTVALVDSFVYAFEHGVVPTDTVALADLFDAPLGRNVDLVDVAAMNDALTLSQAHPLDLVDAMAVSDALSLAFTTVAVAGSPKLTLKGKVFTVPPPVYAHFAGFPDLTLKGKSFVLRLSIVASTGKSKLILKGKPATGEQPGLTVSYPVDEDLVPTIPESMDLVPSVPQSRDLVPTVEEFR